MSDINLDFTVSNNSIDFTVEPNEINFTPTDVQLTIYASGAPTAAGSNTQLQYNNQATLAGTPAITYDNVSNIVTITNTIINAYSITSQNSNLGDVSNVSIGGGVNGYVLQTDGTGNLNWTAQSGGGGGNGTPGGSNTQIQYNDNGTFGGNAGFTFNEVSGNLNVPGNLSVVGNIFGSFNANFANFAGEAFNVSGSNVSGQVANALVSGTVYTNAQPNITSVGTLTSVSVSGNANIGNIGTTSLTATGNGAFGNISSSGNVSVTGNVTAANFIGNVTGNISGHANTANTVTNNAQPNITSVGTLTSVSVSGNANIGNIGTGGLITAVGNVRAGNLITVGVISATGNAQSNIYGLFVPNGGGIGSNSSWTWGGGSGMLHGSGSISAGYIYGANSLVTPGNVQAANVFANATISTAFGNITAAGGEVTARRLISIIANGTPPLTVTSTTLVANLNVANAAYASSAGALNFALANVGNIITNVNTFLQPGSNYYLGFAGARVNYFYANNANISNLAINNTLSTAVSTVVTHKVPISIGGTTYYMCLTNTP